MENNNPVQSVPKQQPAVINPEPLNQTEQKPMLRSFSNSNQQPRRNPFSVVLVLALVVVLAGVGTGYVIAKSGESTSTAEQATPSDTNLAANEAGLSDESHFEEDAPEGVLQEGGLNGEGTHHLDRNAGPQKMVYLTSAVINLDNFVGKKVKVWGNTMAAQEAPWLMDVGKIKVIE